MMQGAFCKQLHTSQIQEIIVIYFKSIAFWGLQIIVLLVVRFKGFLMSSTYWVRGQKVSFPKKKNIFPRFDYLWNLTCILQIVDIPCYGSKNLGTIGR